MRNINLQIAAVQETFPRRLHNEIFSLSDHTLRCLLLLFQLGTLRRPQFLLRHGITLLLENDFIITLLSRSCCWLFRHLPKHVLHPVIQPIARLGIHRLSKLEALHEPQAPDKPSNVRCNLHLCQILPKVFSILY